VLTVKTEPEVDTRPRITTLPPDIAAPPAAVGPHEGSSGRAMTRIITEEPGTTTRGTLATRPMTGEETATIDPARLTRTWMTQRRGHSMRHGAATTTTTTEITTDSATSIALETREIASGTLRNGYASALARRAVLGTTNEAG
jgi:hypothetical protein